MGYLQREIDRLHDGLLALKDSDEKYKCLHAARQALEWAQEPNGVKAPYEAIMGTREGQGDCSDELHPPRFEIFVPIIAG